jgi:hypothetical protein
MQENGINQMLFVTDHIGLCVLITYNEWILRDIASTIVHTLEYQ